MTDLPDQGEAEELTVADGRVVAVRFVARDASTGREVDRADAEEPMRYLHGKRSIIPGLEKALAGKTPGDRIEVAIPPTEAYGEKPLRERTIQVRRSELPVEGAIERGMSFVMRGPQGEALPVWVKKKQGAQIVVTPVHPLAGATLQFECEILEVRDATEEELAHGHAHGPGGHEHDDSESD